MNMKLNAAIVAASFAFAGVAGAQVLLFESTFEDTVDGDGNPAFDGYTYDYGYSGNGTINSEDTTSAIVAGAGVGGSNGAVLSGDFTDGAAGGVGGFFGFGTGTGGGNGAEGNNFDAPSSLADYTLTFSVSVSGANADVTVQPQFQFQTAAGNVAVTDGGASQVTYDVSAGGFQTFTVTPTAFASGDLAAVQDAINDGDFTNLNLNFNIPEGGNGDGGGVFGFDADNTVTFDNVSLIGPGSPVPEPTSLALLGLGGLAALRRRR